jgi:hypothetical protein
MKRFHVAALLCIAGAAMLACSHDDPNNGQTCQPIIDGIIIYAPGIDLQVRDPFGRGQAIGTTAIIRRSDGTVDHGQPDDTVNIVGERNVAGTFTVTLSRPYYSTVTLNGIKVFSTGCSVRTTTVPVTMPLSPGAPALRALTILGQDFLYQPGVQRHLIAYFDANPSVSRAVVWTLSDTTLATVDASGTVTAKCSKAGGTETVTATAVYDGTTSASAQFGVAPAASCP